MFGFFAALVAFQIHIIPLSLFIKPEPRFTNNSSSRWTSLTPLNLETHCHKMALQ